jgi:glycosyltransferase involved in cell wall biosynthesis
MKIGFDAKRAYNNNTGLGHYSRTLIKNLAKFFPNNAYVLFAPKITNLFTVQENESIQTVTPQNFLAKIFKNIWRGSWVKNDLKKWNIDLYHGLSHQIPIGIQNTKIKSVVTIHDLIFERYPEQHGKINTLIYRNKFKNACKNSDAVIAISEQTKNDIVDFYKTPAEKIFVCYQTCNPMYMEQVAQTEKERIKIKYNLPEKYLLSVGSITERKNLLTVCKALKLIDSNIPLVVIGNGGSYLQKVRAFLQENKMEQRVISLNEMGAAQTIDFKTSKDFPAIYQSASIFIYTSLFEGFGIPILEAMYSAVPVIASNTSCMPETGGDAAMYVNPTSELELADAIKTIWNDAEIANEMIEKGNKHVQNFTAEKCTNAVMEVYKKVML